MDQVKSYAIPIHYSFLNEECHFEVSDIIAYTNHIIESRGGIILEDNQILRTKIGRFDLIDISLQRDDPEKYSKIDWTDEHRTYFGIENPYQLTEDQGQYGENWLIIDVFEPFLEPDECILALLDAKSDDLEFVCTCHSAQVVYTSKSRFVCMVCGRLLCVLRDKFSRQFHTSMSADDWFAYFAYDATKEDEEIDLDILDFQDDVEKLPKLWEIQQWIEASRRVTFFGRATPEEYERYKGSIITPDMLIEVGFSPVVLRPSPVKQLSGSDIDVNILDNAFGSLQEAIVSYLDGKKQVDRLKFAVLEMFHAIELLLKVKITQIDERILDSSPNNPTIIKLLRDRKVNITNEEVDTITKLRKLRNALQHREISLGYRSTLSVLKKSIVFVDRFTCEELNYWIGEIIDGNSWFELLKIEQIKENAEKISKIILDRLDPENNDLTLLRCPRCKKDTLLSAFMEGSICIYCRNRPLVDDIIKENDLYN